MVRVCCACGAQDKALKLVADAQAQGVKPRLRTLSAVLLQASEARDQRLCDELWAQLPSLGLEPQDSEPLSRKESTSLSVLGSPSCSGPFREILHAGAWWVQLSAGSRSVPAAAATA